jgi:hypothetical protein
MVDRGGRRQRKGATPKTGLAGHRTRRPLPCSSPPGGETAGQVSRAERHTALAGGTLPDCQGTLAACTAGLSTCNGALNACDRSLLSTQRGLIGCMGDLATCESDLASCQAVR